MRSSSRFVGTAPSPSTSPLAWPCLDVGASSVDLSPWIGGHSHQFLGLKFSVSACKDPHPPGWGGLPSTHMGRCSYSYSGARMAIAARRNEVEDAGRPSVLIKMPALPTAMPGESRRICDARCVPYSLGAAQCRRITGLPPALLYEGGTAPLEPGYVSAPWSDEHDRAPRCIKVVLE